MLYLPNNVGVCFLSQIHFGLEWSRLDISLTTLFGRQQKGVVRPRPGQVFSRVGNCFELVLISKLWGVRMCGFGLTGGCHLYLWATLCILDRLLSLQICELLRLSARFHISVISVFCSIFYLRGINRLLRQHQSVIWVVRIGLFGLLARMTFTRSSRGTAGFNAGR